MTKTTIIILVLIVGLLLWLYTGKWTEQYRQKNVNWRVSGAVVDARTKKPVKDVDVQVSCWEAITRSHKVQGAPVSSSNFVVKADEKGEFHVQAFGGRIFLKFDRKGYEVAQWEQDSRKCRSGIETSVEVELAPTGSETDTRK